MICRTPRAPVVRPGDCDRFLTGLQARLGRTEALPGVPQIVAVADDGARAESRRLRRYHRGTRCHRVPSVETPTVRTDRSRVQNPSVMRPWTPRHSGLQRHKMTHGGTEKNGPPATRIRSQRAVSAGSGKCWVRTNVGRADGFAARRLYPRSMPLTSTYAVPGPFRAAAVRHTSVRTGLAPRTGAEKPTDEAGGNGYADRSPGFLPLTCHFSMPARCRRLPGHRARTRTRRLGC
jgi:hypothetical protein